MYNWTPSDQWGWTETKTTYYQPILKDYHLVIEKDDISLNRTIKSYIERGYTLYGDPIIKYDHSCAQAVVKYEYKKPTTEVTPKPKTIKPRRG